MQKTNFFSKRYIVSEIENKIYKEWEKDSIYDFSFSEKQEYVIDTPPPTISGKLHIGHCYSYAQSDFIARYKRMQGFSVFYPIGFDDNGLATERFVEKKASIRSHAISKEEFIRICTKVVDEEKKNFAYLLKRIGLSLDWNLVYNTKGAHAQKISQLSFIDLYNKGEIYRNEQPVIWDVIDQTALSQADLVDKEQKSYIHQIKFKTNIGEDLFIATTRPELLAACLAIFVHPSDERFTKFKNAKAFIPLFETLVPIYSDDLVDPSKGTGAVMCCSFGDQLDLLWCRKYNLQYRTIITTNGKINIDTNCFASYNAQKYVKQLNGLNVMQARSCITKLLQMQNILINSASITHVVKTAERSGAIIEFILFPQWFIHLIKHKQELSEFISSLNWYPEYMRVKMDNWVNSLVFDWCISRQRVFGVPFPVWYSKRQGEEGKVILAEIDQLPVDPQRDLPKGYSQKEVIADIDVMDTWATSALSPQINAWGISEKLSLDHEKYARLFPANLRSQAHEIIRSWAFYSILKSFLHEKKLPWKDIMISGWCLAPDKAKMSKSKANVIEPISLIQEYGSDAIRYWAALSKLGSDTVCSIDVLKNGKKFINKLWNSANFIYNFVLSINDSSIDTYKEFLTKGNICEIDKIFINKIYHLEQDVKAAFDEYRYYNALVKLEYFFLIEFCDYYIEIIKKRSYCILQNSSDDFALSAIYSMIYIFEVFLKMLAPFFPFVTEEIYRNFYSKSESIHKRKNWPRDLIYFKDSDIEIFKYLVKITDYVRLTKSKNNYSLNASIASIGILLKGKAVSKYFSEQLLVDLGNVTGAGSVFVVKENTDLGYTSLSDDMSVKLTL